MTLQPAGCVEAGRGPCMEQITTKAGRPAGVAPRCEPDLGRHSAEPAASRDGAQQVPPPGIGQVARGRHQRAAGRAGAYGVSGWVSPSLQAGTLLVRCSLKTSQSKGERQNTRPPTPLNIPNSKKPCRARRPRWRPAAARGSRHAAQRPGRARRAPASATTAGAPASRPPAAPQQGTLKQLLKP